jgi:aromatic-amino-acid transaminase
MLDALRRLKRRSVVLLHACCHNPTGVDLDQETWAEVALICQENDLIPLIDSAYQGFNAGLDADAAPIRMMAERGLTFLVTSSYAKSFSMYRERVGSLSLVTGSTKEVSHVVSQLKRLVRTIYSSPPSYGAQLVAIALTNPELRALWETELGDMRNRIHEMRQVFTAKLADAIPSRDFSFIMKQTGMFSYSGLSSGVIGELRERFHIYALDSGRICVAALNHKNVQYVCDSIAAIVGGR